MKISAINHTASPLPPAILFIRRRARVSEAQARVIAGLHGLAFDDWTHLAVPAAQAVASLVWRARA